MRKTIPIIAIIASIAIICGAAATIFLISNSHQETSNPEGTTDDEQQIADILRDRRDEQRIRDMDLLKSAIFQFQANNNGKLPGQAYQYDDNGAIISNSIDGQGELLYQPSQDHTLPSTSDDVTAKLITYYLNNGLFDTENYFVDPDGWAYGLTIIHHDYYESLPQKAADHMIYLVHQATCDTTASTTLSDKPRDFAILYKLESGELYCLDSQ